VRRPIIVLDCARNMREQPQFSGTLVPIVGHLPCLGAPLLLAWSDDSHTKLVPVVSLLGNLAIWCFVFRSAVFSDRSSVVLHKCFLPTFRYCHSSKSKDPQNADQLFYRYFPVLDALFFQLNTKLTISVTVCLILAASRRNVILEKIFTRTCRTAWISWRNATAARHGCDLHSASTLFAAFFATPFQVRHILRKRSCGLLRWIFQRLPNPRLLQKWPAAVSPQTCFAVFSAGVWMPQSRPTDSRAGATFLSRFHAVATTSCGRMWSTGTRNSVYAQTIHTSFSLADFRWFKAILSSTRPKTDCNFSTVIWCPALNATVCAWKNTGRLVRISQVRLFRGFLREEDKRGAVKYKNGDHTRNFSEKTQCWRGKKHFWFGAEYDNNPYSWVYGYSVIYWHSLLVIKSCYQHRSRRENGETCCAMVPRRRSLRTQHYPLADVHRTCQALSVAWVC